MREDCRSDRAMKSQTWQPTFNLKASWENIEVEYSYLDAIGEFDFAMPPEAISVAFLPHDRVTWSVDGNNSKTTLLPAGSVFIYSNHNFVWHKRERTSEYINILLAPKFLQQVAIESELSSLIELQHRPIFPDSTILHVAQLFKSEVLNGGLAGKLYVESLRNLLAVHLLRNYSLTAVKPAIADGALDTFKLNKIKDFIEDRLHEDISIADMAAIVHTSQFHFARAFKTAVGTSPHRYLMQRRMERAKVMLEVTKISIAEIAYGLGFANQSHFIAQFRKAVGTTPKSYRDSF